MKYILGIVKGKIDYKTLLEDPKWVAKRLSIFKRDHFKCRKCGSDWDIQCHHTRYFEGKKPWDISDYYLVTLCAACHEEEHRRSKIPTIKNYKKQKGMKKPPIKLNKRDAALQARYDKLKLP